MKKFLAMVFMAISASYHVQRQISLADDTAAGQSPAASQPQTQPQDDAYSRLLNEDVRQDAPWGKESAGLVCRVLVNPKIVAGEPVLMFVEFKNVSSEEMNLSQSFSPLFKECATIEITDQAGQKIELKWTRTGMINTVAVLKPNDIIRVCFPDLNEMFTFDGTSGFGKGNMFEKPGKYSIKYSYTGRKTPRRPGEGQIKMWENTVESGSATFEIIPMEKDSLVVHEWGVFSIYNNAAFANADMMAEWNSLPSCFYRQFPPAKMRVDRIPGTVSVRKPVMYFYSPRPFWRLSVSVDFKDGAPVVWWPCSREPKVLTNVTGDTALEKIFHKLIWEVQAGDRCPSVTVSRDGHLLLSNIYGEVESEGQDNWQKASETPFPDETWIAAARLQKALVLSAVGLAEGLPAGRINRVTEAERFLYYDGLVQAPNCLVLKLYEGQSPILCNTGKTDLQNIFVIDRRGWQKDKPVRFARIGKLDAGREIKVEFEDQPAKDWPAGGVKKVRSALIEAGLFEEEADSMLKIWEKGLFESDGLTAFYLLSRAEYDKMLPLTIQPAPSDIVRVGLVLYSNMMTDDEIRGLEDKVKALAAKLESNALAIHKPAMQALHDMGPVIAPLLKKAMEESQSREVKERGQKVLDQLDASAYLKKSSSE